ncbi:zeta toxin family protein [Brachybacterium alimentarium]|uniref:zeta toxin family protein n=1 Tax=Brachybacterium alimentarium TaxID=47845 RepID=UPI003FD139F2
MPSDEIQRHVDVVRALAKPGAALRPDAPTSSMANPRWWVDGEPTPSRERLHRAIQAEVRDAAPDVLQERRALVLAGPPGAGKGGVKADVLGDALETYRNIDADEFKAALLAAADRDGSFEGWLKPEAVRDLETQGEQFFPPPLELASLVHQESSYLSKALRARAIAAGDNIIVDTVLAGEGSAITLGDQLAQAGYMVQVVDVEVPFALSEQRIRSRWEKEYVAALESGEGLGGRWVPSEYARDVFDGPEGHSKPEHTARLLAERCPAVADYRVYRTGIEQARLKRAVPALEVHWQRSRPGAALRAV